MSHPLPVGGVVREVARLYVDQAPVLMPAAATVFAASGILTTLLAASSPGLALLGLVISVVAIAFFTGMIVELVAELRDGSRTVSAAALLQAVRPVLGQLIVVGLTVSFVLVMILGAGVSFVLSLATGSVLGGSDTGVVSAVLIGVLLFVVPVLFLQTVWSVVAPVVVIERPGGLRALGRSRELVRGNGWRVLKAILLLIVLPVLLVSGIELAASTAGAAVGLVASVVFGILIAPISVLAQAVLYFELRPSEANIGEPPPG